MCSNGLYTEHGIKGLHGFARERYRLMPEHTVRVDPLLGLHGVLLEPATILAKAWDEIDHIGMRSWWEPRRVLVLGAGPVGLMAALLGRQHGLEVHVVDRVVDGIKPSLVRELGAIYHTGAVADACGEIDIVIECTGAPALLFDAMRCLAPNGILCLAGVSSAHRSMTIDPGALNNELVLDNNVVFGTVNANRRHYELAAAALADADAAWLERVITRRLPLDRFPEAFESRDGDVKTVVMFGDAPVR
jgi:threonine dehydrogenase-like Zn-dependent dehydrogenase